jgi:ParB-like chromosome segregation protein Spo0J
MVRMTNSAWPSRLVSVSSLQLDARNPRLGRETSVRAPREIVQYLFDHDKALEVAQSIASRGYFPNEPLLVIKEGDEFVVVEGNRRLAALKALREPGLLEGSLLRQVERLSRQMDDRNAIARVPVTIAPSRRATDQQLAGRHVGTPVLAWQAENRASFILDKLADGYTNDQVRDRLGFSESDIQAARQTRAIADMARSITLPKEIKAKLDNPRAKLFTTLQRVFDSSIGREYLHIEPDSDHGFRGKTTREEFVRTFTQLVTDVALGNQSSRTLNTNEDIRKYFEGWEEAKRPKGTKGSFVPADIISGRSVASEPGKPSSSSKPKKTQGLSKTVVPRDFKGRYGNERLRDIRKELVRLKRDDFPNAGAVLLRVFFELAVLDYLQRTGALQGIVKRIESSQNGRKLPFGVPTLKQLTPDILKIAKRGLTEGEANKVEKAIRYDPSAPFSISELHGFVHHTDLPGSRDIQQFWNRTEPLFRLLLDTSSEVESL